MLNIITNFFVELQLVLMACKFHSSDPQTSEAQRREHQTHLVFHNYMRLGMIIGFFRWQDMTETLRGLFRTYSFKEEKATPRERVTAN